MKNMNDSRRDDTLLPDGDLAAGGDRADSGTPRLSSPVIISLILSPENELALCIQDGCRVNAEVDVPAESQLCRLRSDDAGFGCCR